MSLSEIIDSWLAWANPRGRPENKPARSELSVTEKLRLDEWKECRQTIARFDQIIVDLRKYGFGLVTILLGASGFLYKSAGMTLGGTLGIFVALLVLIGALFCIDRYHEIFLRGAVERGQELEDLLDMGLTKQISRNTDTLKTDTWGIGIYLLFCAADFYLAVGSVVDFRDWEALQRSMVQDSLFVHMAAGFTLLWMFGIYRYHRTHQ